MKIKLALLALIAIAATLIAQDVAQFTRYREIQTIPVPLRTALNNATDTVRASRTNATRTVIRITVTVDGGATNIVTSVEEQIPFREVQ